jgi:FMN phosphatase YigB (HAD superfamily)
MPTPTPDARAVTFDFGQTLAELDTQMLARRLAGRGLVVQPEALDAAGPRAWLAYNQAVLQGLGGHPWGLLMDALLAGAGVLAADRPAAVEWLWSEQPANNLWRRPIAAMEALARELAAASIPMAVLSNSEGRLDELVASLGWAQLFPIVADSGRLGVEKPDRAIFAWTADRLGVPLEQIVHVGDSYAADVAGALGAGARAIWFEATSPDVALPERARRCRNAAEVRAALRSFGVPLGD